MSAPDLSFAVGLPPREAVEYFDSKGMRLSWDAHEMETRAHAHAFTVAKVTQLDLLQEFREAVRRGLHEGETEAWFQRRMAAYLQQRGWWGRKDFVDTTTGEARTVTLGTHSRLSLIWRTNLQTAYMAGRYRAMSENADKKPYWRYVAVMDKRTRPAHAALHGRIFRHDDPAWDTIWPPRGYRCRCRAEAYDREDLEQMGWKAEKSDGHIHELELPDGAGGMRQTTSLKLPGMERAFAPDPGWDHHPGKAAFGIDVWAMRKVSALTDAELRTQGVRLLNGNPYRQPLFETYVERVLAGGKPRGEAQTVGLMDVEVAGWLKKEKGIDPVGVVVLSDRALLHVDRPLHHTKGIALSREELKRLPAVLAAPEAVVWDQERKNLLYLYPADGEGKSGKVVVELGFKLKKRGVVDEILSAYRVRREIYARDTNIFRLIKGSLRGRGDP